MAHDTTLLRGDHLPADAGEEASFLEMDKEAELYWVELGWTSTLEGTLTEQEDDPAGGELTVGLTGDMYYTAPGASEKLDNTPGKQLLHFLGMRVEPDEEDSVVDTPASHD